MSTEQGPPPGARQPSEEELRAALEEQMKRITVPDVVFQTVATLVNLAARKLDEDLEQTKQAIDVIRALTPFLPEKDGEQVKQALSQLQMAYVRASQGEGTPAEGAPGEEGPKEDPKEAEERAKARAKIWTPPGSTPS